MRAKLGLADEADGDRGLVETVLQLLAEQRVDYTIFWRRLGDAVALGASTADGAAPAAAMAPVRDLFADREALDAWLARFEARLEPLRRAQVAQRMHGANPKYILRNHLAEQAIRSAKLKDFSEVHTLLALLQTPFDEHPGFESYADLPPDWASTIEISCSS